MEIKTIVSFLRIKSGNNLSKLGAPANAKSYDRQHGHHKARMFFMVLDVTRTSMKWTVHTGRHIILFDWSDPTHLKEKKKLKVFPVRKECRVGPELLSFATPYLPVGFLLILLHPASSSRFFLPPSYTTPYSFLLLPPLPPPPILFFFFLETLIHVHSFLLGCVFPGHPFQASRVR